MKNVTVTYTIDKDAEKKDWENFYSIFGIKANFTDADLPDLISLDHQYVGVPKNLNLNDLIAKGGKFLENHFYNPNRRGKFLRPDEEDVQAGIKSNSRETIEDYFTQFRCSSDNGRGVATGEPTLCEGVILLLKHYYDSSGGGTSKSFPSTDCKGTIMRNGRSPEIFWDPYCGAIRIEWFVRGGM